MQNKKQILILTITLIGVCFGISTRTFADEKTTSPWEFSAYGDIYYQNSPQAHAPIAPTTGPSYLEGRVFDSQNDEIVLNMVELSAKRKINEVAIRIDLAFGQMVDALAGSGTLANGQAAAANSQESTRNISQAMISYTPSSWPSLALTAGKFYSTFGFETVKAKDNWQYSRSLSFNYAIPYWHEGVGAQYIVIPDKLSATFQIVNAWDGRISAENNKNPTFVFNFNTTPKAGLSGNYNYMIGKEGMDADAVRQLHELNATIAINSKVTLGADYVFGSQRHAIAANNSTAEWVTYGLYAKYTPVSWYTLSPRYETFDDSDKGFALSGFNNAGGIKQKINSWTIANNINLAEGLEGRLEYRTDKSNRDGFYLDNKRQNTNHQNSTTMALLYSY